MAFDGIFKHLDKMDTVAEKIKIENSDRLVEVSKTLRNVKSCNPLDWDNPSAHEVYDRLYIGNRLAAQSQEYMKSLSFTHLLNAAHPGPSCSMSVECERLSQSSGVTYLGLELSDDPNQDIRQTFTKAGDWINNSLEGDNKVLVNCWAGCSRSATIVLAFLMRHRGMGLVQAVRQVKSSRGIMPNQGFIRQLVQYEKEINKA